MTPGYFQSLRTTLLATALATTAGLAQAQPETPMPPPPDQPVKAKPAPKAPQAPRPAAQRRGGPNGEPLHADRLATQVGQPQDFERNALARCEAFKALEDHRSCVERTRQPVAGGSVSGGGVLREYTETVPAR